MRGVLRSLLVIFFLFWPACQALNLPQVDSRLKEQLKTYVRSHHMTPEEYVLSKFKDHDVVFLGEYHRFKHDPELVQHLIPRLYQSGIFTLATEFARREDQPLIEHLLNAPTYDESLARQITFNDFVFWGYQEYVDIFKVAWQLNHGLPRDARKFRILGVNCSPDWGVVQREKDLDDRRVMRRVWRGCDEGDWARVILGEVVAKGEKALVYSGMHHAFTAYRQPIYNEATQSFVRYGDVRMGNHVYHAIGKRAFTISLHCVWFPSEGYSKPPTYAADGYIDAAMGEIEPQFRRAGFDTTGTPFGGLPGEKSIYKHGYDASKFIWGVFGNGVGGGIIPWWARYYDSKFTLGMFCDGYIYQMPLREYAGVTPIKDFINEKNLPQARLQSPNPRFRNASVEDFNRAIAHDADMRRRLAAFR